MKNVLLINGHQRAEIAKGELNRSLIDLAQSHLEKKGCSVKSTTVDDGYDVADELEKFRWADIIIFQTPVYWMSVPAAFKQYIDAVYSGGHGVLFTDDGRTRTDPSKKYGSGGLMHGKRYMLSTTWNAPLGALEEPDQLFEGKGVDGVFFWFHKAQQFVGMEQLPTFSCYDVMKSPEIGGDFKRYEKHLDDLLAATG
jgi:modulator of drug activity B